MIKVLLADDHQIFRQGLYSMLQKTDGIEVVGDASDGQDALKQIENLKPDVAILDVAMPGLEGIEVSRRIKKSLPSTRILMLSMHADKFYAVEALKAGALGYLLKEESFDRLIDAVKAVYDGQTYLSPSLESAVMQDMTQFKRPQVDSPGSVLTDREREILKLITEGLTNQEIAEKLCISAGTVDTHRKNIMAKLDIHSVAALVRYAIKHKIVTV